MTQIVPLIACGAILILGLNLWNRLHLASLTERERRDQEDEERSEKSMW